MEDFTVIAAVTVGLTEMVRRLGVPSKFLPLVALIVGGVAGGTLHMVPPGIVRGLLFGLVATGMVSTTFRGLEKIIPITEINFPLGGVEVKKKHAPSKKHTPNKK